MSGNRREKVTLQTQLLEDTEANESATLESAQESEQTRDVYLREGRTLSVKSAGAEDLVEIRSASGLVEVRIRLTEDGPVLQIEAARLQLRASEAVEIESKRVEIKATESATIASDGELTLSSESDLTVDAEGEVRVHGKMIYLN